MKHLAWTAALLSALVTSPLVQDEDEVDSRALGLRRPTQTSALAENLRGGWQLMQLESDAYEAAGRNMRGFLLIGEGFLSIEIHMSWTKGGVFQEDIFQSGTHEFELDSSGVMQTRTIIGAGFNESGELAWENPGIRRRYTVNVNGNFLNLKRADGSRLTFTRRLPTRGTGKDIFGRPIDKKGEVDIFGRPIEAEEVDGETVEEKP